MTSQKASFWQDEKRLFIHKPVSKSHSSFQSEFVKTAKVTEGSFVHKLQIRNFLKPKIAIFSDFILR